MIHDVDFPDPNNPGGSMCADQYYGKKLSDEDLNKPICEGEDISFGAYTELDKEMQERENGTWQTH